MNIILSSKGHHYMAIVSIFLIMVALIVGMVGCFTPFRTQYQLTLSSTEGGEVTTPGEGIFTYWEETAVNLVAEADEGYIFVNWTGDVYTIDDVYAASTNITINCDHIIIANFAPIIEIWDWYDLDAIRDNLGGSYVLMNNLDSSTLGYEELASPAANQGKGWEPIRYFTGTFDGQNYEIRDLYINRSVISIGLFGQFDGVIQGVGMVNTVVIGDLHVGSLIGGNYGTVRDCYSSANVTGNFLVGGLVGTNTNTISNSYFTGNVTGSSEVGGLAGDNFGGTVSNSYSTSHVTGDGSAGGLVGENGGIVTNCYSAGTVSGEDFAGGLVGSNEYGTVTNSFWDTETSGQSTSDGGTGKNTTEMKNITTFSGATWNITTVSGIGERNPAYIWNIVNDGTYPFLSWQPVS